MFIISQYILNTSGVCKDIQQVSTYSIALGLIVYSSIYLYVLFYNNEYLGVFNKFIMYVVIVDILLSVFYYVSTKNNEIDSTDRLPLIEDEEYEEDDDEDEDEDDEDDEDDNESEIDKEESLDEDSQMYIDNLIREEKNREINIVEVPDVVDVIDTVDEQIHKIVDEVSNPKNLKTPKNPKKLPVSKKEKVVETLQN